MRIYILLVSVFLNLILSSQNDSILFYIKKNEGDSIKQVNIERYIYRILKSGDSKKAETKFKNVISYYKEKDPALVIDYNSLLSKFYFNIGQFDKSISTETNNIEYASKNNLLEKAGYSYFNIAVGYLSIGDINNGKSAIENAIQILKTTSNIRLYAKAIATRGVIDFYEGKYLTAIDYYLHALTIQEKNKLFIDVADSYNNMAIIYGELDDYVNAIKYQREALQYYIKSNSRKGISSSLGNIGTLFYKRNDLDSALFYQLKSLPISDSLSNKSIYINALGNLSSIFLTKKDYEKFKFYNSQVIELSKLYSLTYQYCQAISEKAKFLQMQNNYQDAEYFAKQALSIAVKEDFATEKKENYYLLYIIESKKENFKNALEFELKYQNEKEKLLKDDKNKDVLRKTFEYEYNKKILADSLIHSEEKKLKDAEILATNAMLKSEKILRYSLFSGLALILIFASFIFNKFKTSQKQKEIISLQKIEVENQKHLVDEKNKEILDSISYAKRLQEAILPPSNFVNAHLPDNFILYKPKDIVAGDFYWMETIPIQSNGEIILIAAADSTGHGVPGAMVSLVCSNALNRSVKEFSLIEPGKILDKTRELVLETFAKSTSEVKDGMDISLLSIHKQTKNNTITVKWSGANNPLWYIENDTFVEIKANKQPIGKTDNPVAYMTHEISCLPGTIFYLFTDGYPDQFGGPKGKKFKYKQFHEFLLSISKMECKEQSILLDNKFLQWKSDLEQVDDVCIIGIRI